MTQAPAPKPVERLIYSREQVAELLGGISIATVIRMERDGKLTAIRLTGKKTGQAFYKHADVMKLADPKAA